jgi:hypothetical protein
LEGSGVLLKVKMLGLFVQRGAARYYRMKLK